MTSRHAARLDPGTLHRSLDGDPAKLMRGQGGKRPVEGADRRAGGGDNDDIISHHGTPGL